MRQALSFHTLLVGGNPLRTSAIYALIHKLERDGGVWFARGGTHALVRAMVRQFERLGGRIRYGDPVASIETEGGQAGEIRTRSGWSMRAAAVASNGDVVHSYGLIKDHPRGKAVAGKLRRLRFSPSLFVLHLGIRGELPDLPHHSILFGPRYQGLLKDTYDRGVLADDPSLYVHHPSASDPGMAPPGHATLYALAPVPHLGKLPLDWDEAGAGYAETLIDILQARVHNRDDVIPNLYFVGAGTHPGAGIPGVVASAKATAELMIHDLAA